ncbi:germ cell nuclear acidic peptidase isoform 2-T2 [Cochliomyia hominivorax]
MEQIPSYNLLQAIDPTKIKVPISDRFAKLTLSSNKKKQQHQQQHQQNEPEQQEEILKRQQEKRDIISRDISKQFELENKENLQKSEENPLLRSESSKDTEYEYVKGNDETTMDPLEVSQDYDNSTQLENDVDLLSQQIASMVVEPKAISLSSGSMENLNIELVSTTESQPSSTSDVDKIHIVHNIPINVKEAVEQDTMTLQLTSSSDENDFAKTVEMTDFEDEVEEEGNKEEDDGDVEDESEAITISDTSESNYEQQTYQDVMATSSLPSTSLTSSNLELPCLADDKAERVAAFLRDVSIERRAMIEQGQLVLNDTVDRILDNKEIDKIQETLAKSRQIATADTESMTPDVDNEEVTPKALLEREKRLKALEEAVEKEEETNKSDILTEDDSEGDKQSNHNVHRLANDETQDNSIMSYLDQEKTPKPPSKNDENEAYRLAHDETQCNTEYFLNEAEISKTPKSHFNTKNREIEEIAHRLANMETESNTEVSKTSYIEDSPNENKESNPHRLANDDTMANSVLTDIQQQSLVYNYTQDYTTPKKTGSTVNNNETMDNSHISIHSTPVSLADAGSPKNDTFNSVINSSTKLNGTAPEHSITILETDEESVEHKSPPKDEQSDDKKLSNSFHRDDSIESSECDDQISKIQMSMANINISAKINIKIHIPNTTSTETSEDDQNYESDGRRSLESNKLPEVETEINSEKRSVNSKQSLQSNDHSIGSNDYSKESNDQIIKSNKPDNLCNQLKYKAAKEKLYSPNKSSEFRNDISDSDNKSYESMNKSSDSPNKSSDSVEIVGDPKFLTEAEKLLTQLYGKSWQTPDVMKTLKRSSQSGEKKSNTGSKSSSKKKNDLKNLKGDKSNNKSKVEESILDDFSIFRRNIVKTNLDSTRLATPKANVKQNKEVLTEPRNTRNPLKQRTNEEFMPQTERKTFRTPVAKVVVNKGRVDNDRWRQLIDNDSDSEGDNASDDDDADESWSKNASEIEEDNSDSEFEISPKPKTRNRKGTNKRQGRSNKSDILYRKLNKSKEGEIVYLDLSKEEVEVQDEVPESPPANHDVTFASRLQDILKTCRHEDKAKLPSSTKKSKRKLFTPNFGDDEFEADVPKENEAKSSANQKRNEVEEELLDDSGKCPFDNRGRPKVLDLYNKQLESVKTGKPIFQLTPSPKKKGSSSNTNTKNDKNVKSDSISKTKTDNEVKFKTPSSTIKTKASSKTLQELERTPDYKYSFLKSLDVTVSKVFCHPDALYYRENYRTKKEDLSKLLYDMYNEKLFKNKLDVPITWNKKLSNTAGRCLNKKRMGIRSSVIELSDKVLTSADRLRCTLIHELCHAATWIFNGEGGHGSTWKEWARRANATFPEIPKIGVCHQYDIEYKYTYKCTLCAAKSHAHSKSKKVENIRCSYCHGAIEIFLNKKDKDGNIMPTPVKEPTGFAKFVKDNYKKFKRDDLKHADIMKLLSAEFASLKVAVN